MKFLHCAIQIEKMEDTLFFFEGILRLVKIREYVLEKELSEEIFGMRERYSVVLYGLENGSIEVFVGKKNPYIGLGHIALSVKNREEIINSARKFGLWVFQKERTNKNKLVFIKDPGGNLYELKE